MSDHPGDEIRKLCVFAVRQTAHGLYFFEKYTAWMVKFADYRIKALSVFARKDAWIGVVDDDLRSSATSFCKGSGNTWVVVAQRSCGK